MIESLPEKRRLPAWVKGALIYVGGLLTGLVPVVLSSWFPIAEADIVYVGDVPTQPTSLDVKPSAHTITFHIRIDPKFKNRGFKRGHVESVDIRPVGLNFTPEKVEVIYLDRKPLRWLETRAIRCEFLAVVRLKFAGDPPETNFPTAEFGKVPPIEFGASFRGPDGREIYWTTTAITLVIAPVPPPSATKMPSPSKLEGTIKNQ